MARITDNFIKNAPARQKELDTLAATNKANAENTIKQLQDLGVGGAPIVDSRAALAKLTGGQTLTDDEKRALGLPVTPVTPTPTKDTTTKDPMRNKNVMPDAPAGYVYKWIGSTANGSWVLYKSGTGSSGGGGGGGGGNGTGNNQPSPAATLVSTETDDYGNVIGIYSDGTTKTLISSGRKYKSTVDMDAYALLEETFKAYGLETLVPKIKTYMERGLGSNQAALQLKTEPEYVERFRGNEIRRATGLNVLSEGEYLALEDAYSQTLRAYGLQNYFGIDRKAKTTAMADIIGNDIDATEFKDRIDTVVTRVQNADPAIKRTLVSFYNINDTDLIKYFLDPKANLPKLQEKVTAAEIGSAALGQGLTTNVSDATALALFGITRSQALEGYAKIGETLPTAKKLSSIYGEEKIDYTQTTAEEEVFKGLASAERKRRQLAARETASFGGASGVSKSAFGSATGGAF